jgi:hypothetical protein
MRLVRYDADDNLVLTEDLPENANLPPYAILSHTWKDGEEVTYDEMKKGEGCKKAGYTKIQYCGLQARRDDLQHFWVDTCCIDKSNNAEFQHAIKSMFRWYQRANRCYVYLADVSTTKRKATEIDVKPDASEPSWYATFRLSLWFTRGWTLQELLAPKLVEFYSDTWIPLGDKLRLLELIREITAIPTPALQGTPLHEFRVDERLQWRQNRHTTKEEDGAYCLVGIFGVDIAPVYGIGFQEAFRRLQSEINKIDVFMQHLFVTDPRDDKRRIEETKGGLLDDASKWVLSNPEYQEWRNGTRSPLLWVKGDPGKGKTMLMCSVVNELNKSMVKTDLFTYFFCQATDTRINNATAVLRGLLYLIFKQQPLLAYHALWKHEHAGQKMFEDANAWVTLAGLFTVIVNEPYLQSAYFLVDALDECDSNLSELLDLISRCSSVGPGIKWVISSRNLPGIESCLASANHKMRLSLELNSDAISTAVGYYIRDKVDHLTYDEQTRDAVLEYVTTNAQDTFLWVALVFQNLRGVPKRNVIKRLKSIPPGLNALYERMLQQIDATDDAELCKQILAVVSAVYRPITVGELIILVDELEDFTTDREEIFEIIGLCGSFLTLRGDTIYFVHQSAKDTLCGVSSQGFVFYDEAEVHSKILASSLRAMSALHRDIFGLRDPGILAKDVDWSGRDSFKAMQYSSAYWVSHFCEWHSSCAIEDTRHHNHGAVFQFLGQKFLYWLEFLSLCGEVRQGLASLAKLVIFFEVQKYQSNCSD